MNTHKGDLITIPNSSTLLASLALLFNYGARMVVPVIAHVVCVILECDAASLIGSTASAFFVGDWIAQLVASPLVSRFGGKRLLCIGTVGWSFMMLFIPFIFNYRAVLLLAQAVMGLFCGLGYPSSHALIAASVPEPQKSTAVSLINSGGGLGSMFGNLTTPLFVGYWQVAFQLFFLAGICTAALVHAMVPSFSAMRKSSEEGKSSSSADEKKQDTHVTSCFAEMKEWLKEPLVQGIVLTYWGNGVIWYGFFQSYLPSLFVEVYAVPVAELGWVTTTSPLMYAVASILVGVLADYLISNCEWKKHHCRMVMQTIGTAVPGLTFLLLPFVSDKGVATALTTIGWGCHAFQGAGCVCLMHDVAKKRAAELFVISNAFAKCAGVLSSGLLGYAVRAAGWNTVLLTLAVHYAVECAVLVPLIPRTESVYNRLFKVEELDSLAKKQS